MKYLNLVLQLAVALLPSRLKVPLYRILFGYEIGRGVRIGLSPIVGVRHLKVGDGTKIGWFNVFYHVDQVKIGRQVKIGFLNCFRGGRAIKIGDYSSILRLNTINAIIDGDFISSIEPTLELGAGSVVTTGHWLDFSAGIRIGDHVIVGGRNSSLWTHNRQIGKPITLASHTYLGSEVRLAPGVTVAPFCVVALGSVLSGRFDMARSLIGGNPARIIRTLSEPDLFLVTRKTRRDIPDDFELAFLPEDLHILARHNNRIVVNPAVNHDQDSTSIDHDAVVASMVSSSVGDTV
jgi:acetyltransferase-like isoleucine patch superfamily enzyme